MNEPRNLPPVVLHGIVRPPNRPRYFPGKGCMCSANSAAECCCEGIDWRSREEHRLREVLEDIKADYEFCMDKAHDWAPKDSESDWQAVIPDPVPKERIFVVKGTDAI